jgi:hypothetical protein
MCNILTNIHTPLADNNFSNEHGKTQPIVTEEYSQSMGYVDKEDRWLSVIQLVEHQVNNNIFFFTWI